MALSLLFVTCSTDFELNQPRTTPILYGVLDQAADTQWVKLNKSFLGDGNNFDYAAINDCTEYDNAVITVEEIGGANRMWTLTETYVPVDNNSGIFYTDSQKVYYFVSGGLDASATYKITAELDDDTPALEAETGLIGGSFDWEFTFQASLNNGLELENGTGLANPSYQDVKPKWRTGDNAKRYDLTMRFHYTEISLSGDSTDKFVDYYQGSVVTALTSGGQLIEKNVVGESFYQFISSHPNLQDVGGLDKRVAENIEFIVTAAHDELNTYIEVNQPVSGIVTERPTYTNVTNGIGIFSSANTITLTKPFIKLIEFKRNSIQELAQGQYTGSLLFCSDSAAYVGEAYHCN